MFSLFPPILRFSHIISGLFDNYGQTGEKIITKTSAVACPPMVGWLWRTGEKTKTSAVAGQAMAGQAKDSYYPKKLTGLYRHELC